MDNTVTTCDEITESYDEETKTVPANFNEKHKISMSHFCSFYVLLHN